ncbi:MAG: GspE/PulE family protein [Acidimicrobiia bacterium]
MLRRGRKDDNDADVATLAPPTGAPRPNDASDGSALAAPRARSAAIANPDRPLLGSVLLDRDAIDITALTEAIGEQKLTGERLGKVLVSKGRIDESTLMSALAAQHGLTVIDLRTTKPDDAATKLISAEVARRLGVLPLHINDKTVDVVVSDPSDARIARAIPTPPGRTLRLLVAPQDEITNAINQSYRALDRVSAQIDAFKASGQSRTSVAEPVKPIDIAPDAPVVQVVNLLVTQALRDRASDVHIEPLDERLRIRFRVDGALHEVLSLPIDMAPAVVSRIKIMADMNIVERRRPQDGQFALEVDGRDLDVRVSTTSTIFGEKAVLRLLDKSRTLYRLPELGMPRETAERYSKLVRSPFGMVICSGPTGSGKTTTLYATLTEINREELNVMTIEDPVEYVFPQINQIQTNEQADLTFASGLKSILRQDPDVILVGEMRDVETARIAVQSALTGHFVLSSLHATDATAALYRLLDMGIEPFLVASSALGIVGQRLVRRICTHCKVEYKPSVDEILFFEDGGGAEDAKFYKGEGCNLCAGTGYYDRVGVYELLTVSEGIRKLLVTGGSPDDIRKLAIKQGMRTLREEGIRLVADGVTTIAEIARNIYVVE